MPDTAQPAWPAPFTDPDVTARGEARASVAFDRLKTLWFNTGTLCNIECVNCYIESSPKNERLVYLTPQDVSPFLDEIDAMGAGPVEIGFTGGEPFLNPHMNTLTQMALERGHEALVLTNAMRPMMRPAVREGLKALQRRFGDRLTMRVSLDHHSAAVHDAERGEGAFGDTLKGLAWLAQNGFRLSCAGRIAMAESEAEARAGFAALFARIGADIPADDPARLVLFPEMDPSGAPPEITTACWGILDLDPKTIMCASSRMVVRRKGAARASVIACTLLPYDDAFELGGTIAGSLQPVKLKHKFCAQFCVLGGASCST
ncbi:MAG: radical SAM protein [Oceanicaulis sp.]|nr:radical SAM protein [Oceanicaulis sp.]